MPPAVEVQSPNHWTAREVPLLVFNLGYFVTFYLSHLKSFLEPGGMRVNTQKDEWVEG